MLRLERDVLKLADRQQIWVDAEEFENKLNEANATKDAIRSEELLEEASSLYAGDYLPEELYAEWASLRREALRRRWMGLLLSLAEIRAKRGALANAIEPLDRLLATDPTHETAVRHLMILLTQLDRRGEALRVYHRLANRLQKDYDSDPLPETHELYEALRQGHMRATTPQSGPPGQEKSSANKKAPGNYSSSSTSPQVPQHQSSPLRPTFQANRYKQSPFIGREQELELLRQSIQQVEQKKSEQKNKPGDLARLNSPHFLLLMGEAGIGKTRLAEELSTEAIATGWSVAWSRSYEQEGTIAYRPWIEVLRTLLAEDIDNQLIVSFKASQNNEEAANTKIERLSALLPELRSSLSSSKHYLMLPPEQERLHLWEATVELLTIVSQKSPLLLVLDDLHWTDDSSLELLAYLTRHIQGQQILLVGTYREGEMTPTHNLRTLIADLQREQVITTLLLQPLTHSQIGFLVAHLPEEIILSIQSQAGGNPFFAEELARYSSSHIQEPQVQGFPRVSETSANGVLPETITAVLDRRLNKLSTECQVLLGKAAVLGGSFELDLLQLMTGEQQEDNNEDALLDLLEEALKAGLILEKGAGSSISYHFCHPLIVSHLYKRQSAARRAQLHRRAAQALLQLHDGHEGEFATAITHHLSKGGSNLEKIAHFAEISGDQAYVIAAYPEAQHYYRQAILAISKDLLTTSTDVPIACIAMNRGMSYEPMHLARLLERLGEGVMIQGNYEEARGIYERVLELRNQSPHDQSKQEQQHEAQIQALIWREIGRAWTGIGEYNTGHQCFQRGKEVLQEAKVEEGTAWAGLHLQDGVMCFLEGNYAKARQHAEEALEMLERTSQQPSLFETSAKELQTLTARTALGNPLEVGRAHELIGVVAASIGQLAEALKHLYTALGIFEQHDLVMAVARVCGNIGGVHAMKSERAESHTYLNRSYELSERMGDLPNMTFVMGNLGEIAARAGELEEAESCLRQSLVFSNKINDREHLGWCYVALATTLFEQGKLELAGKNLLQGFSINKSLQSTKGMGTALIALGEFRTIQAIIAAGLPETYGPSFHQRLLTPISKRLLFRAEATLKHAMQLDGLEAEALIDGEIILARISYLLGDLDVAQQRVLKLQEEASQQELTRSLARSRSLLGSILAEQGEAEQATQQFEQALQLFSTYDMQLDYARALCNYGLTLLYSEQSELQKLQGQKMLQEALDIFARCKASLDQEWCARRLQYYTRKKTMARPQLTKKMQRESHDDRQRIRIDKFAAAGTDTPRD
jgi:tetratricopeptide (TPR) repeat protein